MAKLKKNDRVVLIYKDYIPTKCFPVWESNKRCLGTVRQIRSANSVVVYWDNGENMVFPSARLAKVDGYYDAIKRFGGEYNLGSSVKIDPNRAFRYKKRR